MVASSGSDTYGAKSLSRRNSAAEAPAASAISTAWQHRDLVARDRIRARDVEQQLARRVLGHHRLEARDAIAIDAIAANALRRNSSA